jgi:hypothetical protein
MPPRDDCDIFGKHICRGSKPELGARTTKSGDRRKLRRAPSGDVAGDEDGDDRQERGPQVMVPVPRHQKMVAYKMPRTWMGILETPHVKAAPAMHPITEPAVAIMAPCQRKMAEMSRAR